MSLVFCVFLFSSKGFRGSAKRKTLAFFGASLALFQTSKGWRVRVVVVPKITAPKIAITNHKRFDIIATAKLQEFLQMGTVFYGANFILRGPNWGRWLLTAIFVFE